MLDVLTSVVVRDKKGNELATGETMVSVGMFPVGEEEDLEQLNCIWWDEGSLSFLDSGCVLVYRKGWAECQCTHLTDFSIERAFKFVLEFTAKKVSTANWNLFEYTPDIWTRDFWDNYCLFVLVVYLST